MGTFSEISTKNLGHLGGKRGHILKVRFLTDKLPLMQNQVLKIYYVKHFADMHSLYFDVTLNKFKNETLHLQSCIKWY